MQDIFLQAIGFIEQNKWDAAHELVQDDPSMFGSLLHGYLHRIEGDLANASYWYRRANQPMLENSLEQELARIKQLLAER
ncbi:hypothetical protein [Paraglaciecola sp. L3A3]|uniref:hypothetical protein n=1 Tax=Paraglaciecola sp. L3A3 TaxID=2686358 RepID=UPI00131BFDFC|nr:hypothetical protein [Paraglaciecola sp. L3A3]